LIEESAGELEVVLGAEADYLHCFDICLSKLLNGRAFTPAGRSMRGVEPQQHGTIARNRVAQRRYRPIRHIEHLNISGVVRRLQIGEVCFGGVFGRQRGSVSGIGIGIGIGNRAIAPPHPEARREKAATLAANFGLLIQFIGSGNPAWFGIIRYFSSFSTTGNRRIRTAQHVWCAGR